MRTDFILYMLLMAATTLHGEIISKTVEYKQGDTVLEGVSVYDDAASGKRPAVLVVHQWKGLGDYEKNAPRCWPKWDTTSSLSTFMGKGFVPQSPQEAGAQAGKFKNDRALLRDRVRAGLEVLARDERTDPKRVAAIGYCFGGTTVLELARSGADVAGVVSFHGGLGTPTPDDAKNIHCKVLALHGADDPNVPTKEVGAFEQEMRDAKVDWQLVAYGGAVHAFTDWNAGSDNSRGAAYNERADHRSWEAMKQFFDEIFAQR